jgi:tetratricopeptide (TPR) repeat protein
MLRIINMRRTVTRSSIGRESAFGEVSGGWLGCLVLAGALFAGPFGESVHGQNKTAKKPGKTAKTGKADEKDPDADAPPSPFEELSFEVPDEPVPVEGEAVVDLDDTPDGKQRLQDVTNRAREIFRERDVVERDRRPIAGPRDVLFGEIVQFNQTIALAQQNIMMNTNLIADLQEAHDSANGNERAGYKARIAEVQNSIRLDGITIGNCQGQIRSRMPRLEALNNQIRPLDERLAKLWGELNNCRKQWLEIRQPQKKYAHADFESLKRVLDDWLRIDGMWPEAFCWAALCAYELGDTESAWNHVEKAGEIRQELRWHKSWAHGEALRGLIGYKIRAVKSKAAGFLQSAQIHANKNKKSDWLTYFLVGRANFENDKQASTALANFEKALKIHPNEACVKYWYGRLQTTTTSPKVRDVKAGTAMLENLWDRSAKKSWRLSVALVLAYDAGKQPAKANAKWELTLQLAPKAEHATLVAMRDAATKKLSTLSDTPASRSSSNKTSRTTTGQRTSSLERKPVTSGAVILAKDR